MITAAATIEAFVVPMPESEHPPTDVESTKASSVSIAPAPFNNVDLDADLIFRTSDNVDFYVHKLILKKASSFFADMLTLAQDTTCSSVDVCQTNSQNHPVVTSFSPSCPSQRLALFSTVF